MRGNVAVLQMSTFGSFESLVIPRSMMDSGCVQRDSVSLTDILIESQD